MKIFITHPIPGPAQDLLRQKGYAVVQNESHDIFSPGKLAEELKKDSYDAVISLLIDPINKDVLDAVPQAKIIANYAVGFNNIDLEEAKKRNIFVTNTPGVLTDSVAEHTMALLLSLSCRIVEGDAFMRSGKYQGWDPFLLIGQDLKGKTMGILGGGRIGSRVAYHAKGFDMNVIYYDVARNEHLEKDLGVAFKPTVEEVVKEADAVIVTVPLLDSTHHLINKERLALMKTSAYLVNTSRGPVVDEVALVEALKAGTIRGAALDVFEFEPKLADGLIGLSNVVLTPHIASATEFARSEMSRIAAENVIDALEGREPKNIAKA